MMRLCCVKMKLKCVLVDVRCMFIGSCIVMLMLIVGLLIVVMIGLRYL